MHPAAKRDTATPAPPTGIDYLALVRDRHTQILTAPLAYADLARPTTGQATATPQASLAVQAGGVPVLPGQTDLLELLDLLEPTTATAEHHRQDKP